MSTFGRGPRIAHINLARGYRGGERQTELLIRSLAAEGWRQRLVGRRDGSLLERCAKLSRLEIRGIGGNGISALFALQDVDLTHVHEGRAIQGAYLNSLLRRSPYLVTRRVQQGPRVTSANRCMYGRASAIVTVSAAIAQSMRCLNPDFQLSVIPDATSELGADAQSVQSIRDRYLAKALVGNVAALVDSHKGQLQIIDIARRVERSHPGIHFLLVGGGEDEARLRATAADLGNLHFVGHVDNVGDYLAAFDVFFYPSRHEGLGSVLLDAMEFGLPVVATRVGGIPEIVIDGVNGLLCDVDDLDAQCAALLKLIHEPVLARKLSMKNKEQAKNYRPAIMAQQYAAIYQQILGGKDKEISSP